MIRCAGKDIGRVYLRRLLEGERWLWSITINGHVPEIEGVPISGYAITLDEADAAFKRSYEVMREKAGLPKPQRGRS
jgi:hypothetical protein